VQKVSLFDLTAILTKMFSFDVILAQKSFQEEYRSNICSVGGGKY